MKINAVLFSVAVLLGTVQFSRAAEFGTYNLKDLKDHAAAVMTPGAVVAARTSVPWVLCDITETKDNVQKQFKLQAPMLSNDSTDEGTSDSSFVVGVTIDLFACLSCSVRAGKNVPEISVGLSGDGVSSNVIVQSDSVMTIITLKNKDTVAVNCVLAPN